MNLANIDTNALLPDGFPTTMALLLAVVGVAGWAASHLLLGRLGRGAAADALRFVIRCAVGTLAMLAVFAFTQRLLTLATNWSLWPIALLGAFSVEAVLALYSLERQTVSRRLGSALAALRVLLVLLAVGMLTQPTRTLDASRGHKPVVAIFVDESASMHVADTSLTPAEKVRLASVFGMTETERPVRLDEMGRAMGNLHRKLAAEVDWLQGLQAAAADARAVQLDGRRKQMRDDFKKASGQFDEAHVALGGVLDGRDRYKLTNEAVAALQDIRGKLASHGRDRLQEAHAICDTRDAEQVAKNLDRLTGAVRSAAAACAYSAPKLNELGQELDKSSYDSLSPDQRKQLDALARRTRFEVARQTLRGQSGSVENPSLPARLRENYQLRTYRFAAEVNETTIEDLLQADGASARPDGAAPPPEQLRTDLAGALHRVRKDVEAGRLAAVVLITDGRHNAETGVEAIARQLGGQGVAVCSIVVGSSRPPLDAGVVAVEAPETVFAKDQLYIDAEIKVDGMAGKEVTVELRDGEKVLDTQKLRVPTDRHRTRVQLSDTPEKLGVQSYRVTVEQFEGEVFETNNEYPVTVHVTDDRVKVLLVEGRPRWEFRYLKNLFSMRDKTVSLQYVLVHPDRIADEPARRPVPAAADRPRHEPEATALPGKVTPDMPAEEQKRTILEEWMKFDLIFLGDVPPETFRPADYEALDKFVKDRGGTLVLLAGPLHMPHRYENTIIEELAPMRFEPKAGAVMHSPDPQFRLALTADGQSSPIMRQKTDPAENLDVWRSIPPLFWRHAGASAKPGATVLAYALPANAPDFLRAAEPGQNVTREAARLRGDYERQRALIALQNVSMGRVMMLSTDRTWRLRYRIGDAYHHKFWGQVVRWATANKLGAGGQFVRLGTDGMRYNTTDSIEVRAKLLRQDYSPVHTDDVFINVYRDKDLVLRRKLEAQPDSPGIYSTDLSGLPVGPYRVELDSPTVTRDLLPRDNLSRVESTFSVDRALSQEEAELTADRGLLGQLATLSGGLVAEPLQAGEIADLLGSRKIVEPERREFRLWNSWPLLVLVVLVAAAEWLLRKKEGLA